MDCLRGSDELFARFNVSTSSPSSNSIHSNLLTKDVSSTKNTKAPKAFVGRMGNDETFEHSIPNAWMASPPGHPFFGLMMQWATAKISSGDPLDSRPEAVTGPIALRDGIKRYNAGPHAAETKLLPAIFSHAVSATYRFSSSASLSPSETATVEVLPPQYIYPYSWYVDGEKYRDYCWSTLRSFDAQRCKDMVGVERWPSWTITYWSHTWDGEGPNKENIEMVQNGKG